MQEGEVKTGLCLGRWNMVISQARYPRWIQEQSTMGFKSERLGARDDDLGCSILVGYVDSARPVLVMKPRVGAHQLQSLLLFGTFSFPPSAGAFASEDDRGGERESGQQTGCPRCIAQFGANYLMIFVEEGGDGLLGSRGA